MGRYLDIARSAAQHREQSAGLDVVKKSDTEKIVRENPEPAKQANYAKEKAPSPDDSWEWIEERSAVIQYDGRCSGDIADAQAFKEWFRLYVEDTP